MTTRLLLLKRWTREAESSPELRFLLSSCAAEARRVFDGVEVEHWTGTAESAPERPGPALILGAESVYVGRQSLERMREALESGAGVVLPESLHTLPIAEDETPHTLRGFERLEHRLLEEQPPPSSPRPSHLPVALLSESTIGEWLARHSIERVLTDETLLAQSPPQAEVARAGLYYQFIDYYGELREDVLPHLPEGLDDVLEVGCGRGHTGALLQDRRGCRVTGVELHPDIAADAATRLSRVIVGDIEKLDLEGPFDAVVATELLEHLTRPEDFLLRMKSLLRPGGRIVLSTPNVGHHSVVEDLLAGRWDYVPMGLLCYTHYRFFTRSTLEDWISRLGFASWEIHPQTTSLPPRFRQPPEDWELDPESLRTHSFLVVLHA